MQKFMSSVAVVFFSLSLLALPAYAADQWYAKRVYVKEVKVFHRSSNTATRVIYEVDADSELPSFSCAPNTTAISGHTNRYQATYWASPTNVFHQLITGQLLAAQAQNFPVDIWFDASGCNTDASWGDGGLGVRMHGVSVSSE